MFSLIQARFTAFELANSYVICLSANLYLLINLNKYNVKLYRLLSICSYWLIAFRYLLAVNDLKHQHGSKTILNLIYLSIYRSLPLPLSEPTDSTFLQRYTKFIDIDLLQLTILSAHSKSSPKECSCRSYVSL